MRAPSRSTPWAVWVLLAISFLPLPIPNPFIRSSWAQSACTYSLGGCQCSCAGQPGIPEQYPPARSYDSFIIQAYQGAYGRFPTCFERYIEYNNLVNAAARGALLSEASRFIATLIMTQASYDVKDLITYRQTNEYQARNPQERVDRTSIESYIADLYRAYLQRAPDLAGQCHWSNDICSLGRKKGVIAFEVSPEFGRVVAGLFDDGVTCDPFGGGGGGGGGGCQPGLICE
jgi:Domain of unknown function (DUF4214)